MTNTTQEHACDVLILGSGAAGLSTAIALNEIDPHCRITVLSRAEVDAGSTAWAQGGLAVVTGTRDTGDTLASHIEDTMIAGGFHGNRERVATLIEEAAPALDRLVSFGAHFDPDLHLEGGHSHRRIFHAGDHSGAEVERALIDQSTRLGITIIPKARAVDLLRDDEGGIRGALVFNGEQLVSYSAGEVVIASGGIGALWPLTSNPSISTGDGLAMALRAGAATRDLEFVQFHPTVLARKQSHGRDVLISEAVRGEGAVLIDAHATRFMPKVHEQAELAPRDVVTAAIAEQLQATDAEHVFLDARSITDFPQRFPSIHAMLTERGIDATTQPIPVRPGAHYHCGGIAADLDGRTNLPGLSAVGEAAGTGIQGANRLASNSLTEALVTGHRLGERLAGTRRKHTTGEPSQPIALIDDTAIPKIRAIMDAHVGVVRSGEGLHTAEKALASLPLAPDATITHKRLDASNMATAARAIAHAARVRTTSLGCHRRKDHS